MRGPLSGLAASVDRGSDPGATRRSIAHFAKNHEQARLLFARGARAAITRVLAAMLAEQLAVRAPDAAPRSLRLAAVAIAESQMGTLAAWLRAETEGSIGEVANALHAMASACAHAVTAR